VSSVATASNTNGTVSLVARESPAEAGAPTVSPSAQAKLSSIVPKASAAPIRSNASVISDTADIVAAASGPPSVITATVASGTGARAPNALGGGSGYRSVLIVSPSDTASTLANVVWAPTATASVPSIGPTSVPNTAEANTDPSTSLRRARGAIAITHARPLLQM